MTGRPRLGDRALVNSLRVGDRVLTDYREYSEPDDTNAVRTVLLVDCNENYGSGRCVIMSATEPCPTCGHVSHRETPCIDACWVRCKADDE
jgi:hypothetical protein